MKLTDTVKLQKFKKVFFTIKILAILFCVSPIFQYFFDDTTENTLAKINIPGILISLVIIVAITFMWVISDYEGKYQGLITVIEITIFYPICVVSVMLSDGIRSYYKFMFIFMVVSYTIELGTCAGFVISGISAAFLLSLDIFYGTVHGVNTYFQSDVALCAMFFVVAWILGVYVKLENEHIQSLKDFANLDGLTKVYNHRCFYERFEQICDSGEKDKAISLLLIDIDDFKAYNDMFGHQSGDNILRDITKIIQDALPDGATEYRYGGDELAVILPDSNTEEALKIAEKLRTLVQEHGFTGEDLMPNGILSISIGVAALKNDGKDNYMEVISRADSALYKAKFFRKNKVEVFSSLFDEFSKLSPDPGEVVGTVKSFLTIINSRDCYTYSHTERVVRYCEVFADFLGLDIYNKKILIYSAYLHDLGKINVSKSTLITENRLSKEEWEEIRRHPWDGAEIIRQMKSLDDLIPTVVVEHHEKFDGTGYPEGLSGEKIHPLARMLTLADSFDAMTAKRPYQTRRTYEEAFSEIRRCSGTQFDPILSEQFIEAINTAL